MPALSILLPHKHEPENDKALAIALSCIVANTRVDYELIVDTTTPGDPYVILNDMARRAKGEWLFFGNSDLFVAPKWDVELLNLADPDTMTSITLVEPGAIGVHIENIHHSFGMTPETFRRAEFEAWAATDPELPAGNGFYFYALRHRQTFLDRGGFDTSIGAFPIPLDINYHEAWLRDGKQVVRSKALAYHLQNFSNPLEQEKAVTHS
jgi:hypothetical protein